MNAPKLRFKGFTENWCKISISALGTVITGNTPTTSKKEYYGNDFLWVSPADIRNQKVVNDTQTKLSILGFEKMRRIPNGSILVTCIGSTIGKLAMSGKELSTNQQINSLIPSNPNLKEFIYYSMEYYIPLLKKLTATQAVPIINKSEFSNFKLPFTSENEAIKIGDLFNTLYKRIQLQQEKIDLLKEQKKGYMQKIFSQDLRFKNEDVKNFPDWSSKPLKDIINVNSGRDYKHLDLGNIPVYGTGGYMLSVNDSLSTEDAIGIGRKGTINNPQKLTAPFWTVDTLFYCTAKESNDLNFIYLLFQYINWKKYDESTGVPSLSKNSIESIIYNIPCYEEQRIIGSLFNKIDEKIKLEFDKLTVLQNQKQAFMQQMFI